jgi:hypothetical protein
VGNAVFIIGKCHQRYPDPWRLQGDGEWYNFDHPRGQAAPAGRRHALRRRVNFIGNVFAVSTTHLAGAEVNFDNVFFYKKRSGSGQVVLPSYASQALTAEGSTTFDIAGARDVVLIGTSTGVTEGFNGNIKADYNVDDVTHYLYVWDGTYTAESHTGKNSFGYDEGYTVYTVGTAGWSGLGYASAGNGKTSRCSTTLLSPLCHGGTGNEPTW